MAYFQQRRTGYGYSGYSGYSNFKTQPRTFRKTFTGTFKTNPFFKKPYFHHKRKFNPDIKKSKVTT